MNSLNIAVLCGAKRLFSQAEAASKAMGASYPYLYLNYAVLPKTPAKDKGQRIRRS